MNKKRHILFLSSWYPSEGQPFLGNYIRQFAEIMSETCEVTVLVLIKNDYRSGETVLEKISDNFQEIRSFYGESFMNKSKIKAHRKALRFVKTYIPSINLIHAHVGMTNWWHFLWFKRELNVPMVYSEHGSFYFKENYNDLNLIHRTGLKRLIYKSDEITAVSDLLKVEMEKNYPKFTNVIGNILLKSWEQIPLTIRNIKEYKFLHVSTVDRAKNTSGILEAILILKNKGLTNFSLTILSDENTNLLQDIVDKNYLNDYVQFLGPHSHSEMPNVYQSHDCFILNSNYETFSIVLAEALFFGLHIISTKVGFLANFQKAPFDEVEINDSIDLADKMEMAISEQKRSYSDGRDFVKQFSQDVIIKKYTEIYNRLLKEDLI